MIEIGGLLGLGLVHCLLHVVAMHRPREGELAKSSAALAKRARRYHRWTRALFLGVADHRSANTSCVGQKYLARIIPLAHAWIPPFVVQLLGEYVIEIIQLIERNLGSLDVNLYAQFLKSNPEFLALTEQRVMSYWDCYYRGNARTNTLDSGCFIFSRDLLETNGQSALRDRRIGIDSGRVKHGRTLLLLFRSVSG